MNFIDPITITDALIGAGATLAEDPTSAWASGTYALGDERHVVATHRVYRCTEAGSSTVTPQSDPARWQDMRPTNKWAPFDIYTSTAATTTAADIVYPITARFCNALALYGLAGSSYTVVVKDTVGGTTLATRTGKLKAPARGWFDYLFGTRRNATKVVLTGLPMRPAAEITITIAAGSGATRSLGMVSLGKKRTLAGSGQWGGTLYGSSAEPVTYSYINTAEDGTTTITRRHKATNLRFSVAMPRNQADNAVALLQGVLDVPVAWFATENAGYEGLSTFGIAATAPVSYDSSGVATLNGTIKGII
jgi:hypothetical protein